MDPTIQWSSQRNETFLDRTHIHTRIYIIGPVGRVLADTRETGSFPNSWSSHTKVSKMVLDTSLLNTQHYNVRIKGKVEQSRENALPYTSV